MYRSAKPAGDSGKMTDQDLWLRLRQNPFPATRDGRDFAHALAQADDLPLSEARDIEREYRRFLYLAGITDAARVAPPQVRRAWQLHALSGDYDAYCRAVLGKPLPYDDTTRMLGASRAYRQTRAAYRREFIAPPPKYYWPDGIAPRVPRWLGAHAVGLGFAGALAYRNEAPLLLAAGVGLSLVIYALDLYTDHLGRRRRAFGDRMSDDLNFFLSQSRQR